VGGGGAGGGVSAAGELVDDVARVVDALVPTVTASSTEVSGVPVTE
jgi:hypothetical protein